MFKKIFFDLINQSTMIRKTHFSVLIIVTLFSCSSYAFLTKKQEQTLKDDYNLRVDMLKVIGENIHLNNQDTLLDIASGYGVSISIMSNYLPQKTQYFVEDINKKTCNRRAFKGLLNLIDSKANINNFHFFYGKENALPFPSNSFSNATLFISIHEFSQKEAMLLEAARCLRKNGKLFVLEVVARDGFKVQDSNCGFDYITNSSLNELIKKSNFKIFKDTIISKIEYNDSCLTRFLILEK